MERRLLLLTLGFSAAAGHTSAQSAPRADSAQAGVVPISLSRPAYPPIAVSARISGEVEVKIGVRPDGIIESMAIVSGPPLLQPAALEAAKTSLFECRGCTEPVTSHSVVFAFLLDAATPPPSDVTGPDAAGMRSSQSRVTVVGREP